MAYLKVSGTKLVDKDGNEIILRGAGLGGWMKCVQFVIAPYVDEGAHDRRPVAWRTSSLVCVKGVFYVER